MSIRLYPFIILFFAFFSASAQVADSTYLNSVKEEMEKQFPNNRTINLVFHGHSVVAGYWAKREVHTLESYPHLLLKKLKDKYPYAVINVIVTAIGGENSVKGEARFSKDVLIHKPDVIFIDYALNELNTKGDGPKIAWGKMVEAALKENIKVVLLTPSADTRVDMIIANNTLQQRADQITTTAAKYHVGLSDTYSKFKPLQELESYMAGVNHPNQKGHEIIATELFKWFK